MGQIRYCRQCGQALSMESRYCEYCGAETGQKIQNAEPVNDSVPNRPVQTRSAANRPTPNRSIQDDSVQNRPRPASGNPGPRIYGGESNSQMSERKAQDRSVPNRQAQPRPVQNRPTPNRPMQGDSVPNRPVQNRPEAGNRVPQSGAPEYRRMPNGEPVRRDRFQEERLAGSWEDSWNRELPEKDENAMTPIQYVLIGMIVILLAVLAALGIFWMIGRSGSHDVQDRNEMQYATDRPKEPKDDSVITILDGDSQIQPETKTIQTQPETKETQTQPETKETQTQPAETEPSVTIQPEPSSYLMPQSAERLLSDTDVEGMTYDEMQMVINEIYARHGRKFASAEVQEYFNQQSWYQGTVEPENFSESVFNQIESQNIQFLLKKMGIE